MDCHQGCDFSAEYVGPDYEQRPFWKVNYSYRVGEAHFSGEFENFVSDEEVSYGKDDLLPIEYLASDPDQSRVPGLTTWWSKIWIPFVIGGGLAMLVPLLRAMFRR